MDLLLSPPPLALAAFAAAGWLFALVCFIGYHRPRKATRARTFVAVSRPASIVDIEDLRARHARIYKPRRAA